MTSFLAQNKWVIQLLARMAFSAVVFGIGLVAARRWWDKLGTKSLLGYYLIRMISIWVLIFVVGKTPPDLISWMNVTVNPVIMGGNTIWEFKSVYHLGFVAAVVVFVKLFGSCFGMAVFYALAELFAMFFLFRVIAVLRDVKTAKQSIILYLASPFGLMVSWLGAQDEPLIMLAMFGFLYFVFVKSSWIGRIMSLLFGIFFTKILVLFYLFPIAFAKKIKGIVALVGLFSFYALLRLLAEHNIFAISGLTERTTLGSLWFLISSISPAAQLASFAIAAGALIFSMLPAFLEGGEEQKNERCVASCVCVICLELIFSLTNRMEFSAYVLPMIPLLFAFVWHVEEKSNIVESAIVICWLFFMSYKDPLLYAIDPKGIGERPAVLYFVSTCCISLTVALLAVVISSNGHHFYRVKRSAGCMLALFIRGFRVN